jgi:c-di-GMP-binding flagellar brake protein YcgR
MAAAPVAAPPIAPGTHVMLRLPHVGGLPATVEAAEPGALVVVLAVKDKRVARLAGGEAQVEATTARGIQRFGGTLQLTSAGSELLRIVLSGDAERIQRRDWARVDAVVPVTVEGIQERIGGATNTLNVSGRGVLVQDPWRLPLGLDVRIELEITPGEPPIRALGRVVREAAADKKGIRIDDMGRVDEDRLIRFIRERERTALRMGRDR